MVAWAARLALFGPAAALAGFAATANQAWLDRHLLYPALNPPPPSWTLLVLRVLALGLALLLTVCGIVVWRRARTDAIVRVAVAVVLAVGASELLLRLIYRALPVPVTRVEAFLAA